MIEQYTITTTQKYNFPHPTMDTTLPQRLTQLSIQTLKTVQNNSFQLNQQTNSFTIQNQQLKLQPIALTPNHQQTTVAAVDTSSMKIGETSTGTLIAVRGANVWKQNRTYRYIRLGPFLFHATEENKHELYKTLQTAYWAQLLQNHQNTPNLMQMPLRIASLLEKWLQTTLTKTLTNSLILFDGSLTAGTPDTPAAQMRQILETARKRGNSILAFSKMTNLRVNGHYITETSHAHKPPYLLETNGIRPKPPLILFGDIYVAKLTRGNYAFRLDIDKELAQKQKIEAVERLLGNDLISQSYPETLRLAHILCTFTANEVIAMQHFITHQYKLKIVNRPDMHKLLFGPYGKGENS